MIVFWRNKSIKCCDYDKHVKLYANGIGHFFNSENKFFLNACTSRNKENTIEAILTSIIEATLFFTYFMPFLKVHTDLLQWSQQIVNICLCKADFYELEE